MKQPNLAEKIIIVSIKGIYMGISSAIRTFIDLILRLLFGTSAFADCGLSTNISLPLVEAADVDNNKLVDPEVTSESNVTILLSNGKAGFTEAKGSPLFRGLLPNDISIMCRYWYANKFDCIIVL